MSGGLYVTADTHFGHRSILEYTARADGLGVTTLAEHDEALIQAWNDVVPTNGEVVVLGDFALAPDPEIYFKRLHGRKRLIRGNHDNDRTARLPWLSVNELRTVRWEGRGAICCHFPLMTWDMAGKGRPHFHGHSHGHLATGGGRVDVGVDAVAGWGHGYAPVPFEVAFEWATSRPYHIVDHHGLERSMDLGDGHLTLP